MKLTDKQIRLLVSVWLEMDKDPNNVSWFEPCGDDHPATLKSLHGRGFLEREDHDFRLTWAGKSAARILASMAGL